jgi:hypothetical protein
MRFILRKYVDADSAREALEKDATTPVHDCYLKEGEEPKRELKDAVGFVHNVEIGPYDDEIVCGKGKKC